MNFSRGLSFQREDPEWLKKIGIGALVLLVPILNFAAIGFAMDTLRNIYHGRETPLPTWDELGTLFVRGLLTVLVQLVWMLPIFVLLCPAFVLVSLAAAASGEEPGALFAVANICIWGLYMVVSLALIPLILVAQARYAVSNDFSDAMPGPVFGEIRRNLGAWITVMGYVLLMGLLMSIIAVPVVLLTLGLGVFLIWPAQFYIQLAMSYWSAHAHRASVEATTLPPSMV